MLEVSDWEDAKSWCNNLSSNWSFCPVVASMGEFRSSLSVFSICLNSFFLYCFICSSSFELFDSHSYIYLPYWVITFRLPIFSR